MWFGRSRQPSGLRRAILNWAMSAPNTAGTSWKGNDCGPHPSSVRTWTFNPRDLNVLRGPAEPFEKQAVHLQRRWGPVVDGVVTIGPGVGPNPAMTRALGAVSHAESEQISRGVRLFSGRSVQASCIWPGAWCLRPFSRQKLSGNFLARCSDGLARGRVTCGASPSSKNSPRRWLGGLRR